MRRGRDRDPSGRRRAEERERAIEWRGRYGAEGGHGASSGYGGYVGSYGQGGWGGHGGSGGYGGASGVAGYGGRGRGSYGGMAGQVLPPPRGPHYGKGPKGYTRSPARILEDVCERIASQRDVDASDVEVTVEGAVVTLSGTVRGRDDKRILELVVEHVRGVEDVHNVLRVRRDTLRSR